MSNLYNNPLISRYASKEMAENFSNDKKFSTWRKLWIALAEAQRELGLNIAQEQIDEMKKFCENINYHVAKERERETRHDVMSHVYAFGVQCPKAKPIIHLGATSAYVGDNTDVIAIKKALILIKDKLVNLINELSKFAFEYREVPTLGFTHFQPAQLTTVGKRATLWIMELIMDYEDLIYTIDSIMFRGVKGTTGTQASYLNLFNNDHEKVEALDKLVAKKMGFERVFPVTGQTYSRKLDYKVLSVLSGIAQSLHKMTNDIRLLQHLKEVEEPFEKKQIGSSAMAYKRNPMRSERVASLARYVMSSVGNTAMTSSTQWFERTLDDSANRRISIPQSFLATDAILKIAINISQGMVVNDKVIRKHIMEELPFMTTENIIMEAVKRGGDRQELHEKIREYSMEAAREVKEKGNRNNLLDMIVNDQEFGLSKDDIDKLMDPKLYIGRSKEQVEEFIKTNVAPIVEENQGALGIKVTLEV
ncbi:MAG: adenylosuccinate lyase [Anaeromicrobium sp.]|uniref:adenylosuccinate lyase n=1 Tax=Anaeromicrobium sp. TaxID=1929132 RepID=UPI0025F654F7|nr:adenylosuccinate lyase [Anaeromicrobium sp.]MCT4595012.1 adenylosuccinate lyase [Anaeromicrobium sp.]